MRGKINILIFLSLLFPLTSPAWAHEKREVADKYQFLVGFLNEPAFSGDMNAAHFTVTESNERGEVPVTGLEATLQVTVRANQQEIGVKLEPIWNQPGSYAAYFLPSQPGKYVFQISGTMDQAPINEIFESGAGTDHFDWVRDARALQFPSPIETASVSEGIQEIEQERKNSKQALWLGLAGVIVGLAALMVAGAPIVFRPRSR
ncbi:MAG: hypothetical protein HY586_04845 [Candidatus Omnitrophica bacterium]|nr:hypothetical protein [Candidatus Omnitrophota bacterium]